MIEKFQSRILLIVLFTIVVASIVSCTNGWIKESDLPDPQIPILQEVRLKGTPDCPGTCSLPTISSTNWDISPIEYVNQYGRTVKNIRAVVVVDTPLFTDLAVSYGPSWQTHPMQEIPISAGDPGNPNQYRVQTTTIDNGQKLRWFVTVASPYCAYPVTFHFVNVGRKAGNPKSTSLDVSFTRDACSGMASSNPQGTYSTGGSTPASPPSGQSSCPLGETLFLICQKCQAAPGATPIYFYSAGCYASWQKVETIYNQPPNSGCTVSQVSGPSNCELP